MSPVCAVGPRYLCVHPALMGYICWVSPQYSMQRQAPDEPCCLDPSDTLANVVCTLESAELVMHS